MAQRGRGRNTDNIDLPKAKLNRENFKKSFRLLAYLGNKQWIFVLGMFFLLASASIGLLFPLKSGTMFGYFGASGQTPEAMTQGLYDIGKILLFILLIQGVFSFGRVYCFTLVTETILSGLRRDAFSRIIQKPMGFFYIRGLCLHKSPSMIFPAMSSLNS